jgi:glycosyltransferase involved in cell wall biosynthesis
LKRTLSPGAVLALPFSAARGAYAVRRIVREERIDLIHTNMEVVLDGSVAARLWGIPHVIHYRGNTLDRPVWVFDLLTRFWTFTSDRVIAISEATAEVFRKRGLGRRVTALHNPVDVETYLCARRSDDIRSQLGAGPGDVLLGTVGRIHPRKDLDTLLRAAALLARDVATLRVAIVGSAEAPEEVEYQAHLEALVGELGIAGLVCFAGVRSDMPEVFKAFDLFILSSRHEGFGRVVAEAIAAGLAAVVSDEGAPPDLIGDPRRVARAGDPEDFARRAKSVLELPGEYAFDPAAEAARFSPPQIAAKVLEIYKAAIAARTTR